MSGIDFAALETLRAVVARASFRGAARELGVSPSAVSHTIRLLEEKLGVRLLHRTTRSVAPTPACQRLLRDVEPALAQIGGALTALSEERATPSGPLRITALSVAFDLGLLPVVVAFTKVYPDVTLDIDIDDRFTNIVAEGFDAGIRLGESLERDMIAVPLSGPQRSAVVATPAYFERFPPPHTPRDLARHHCIRRRFASGRIYRWEFERDGHEFEVAVEGPLICNESGLMLDAVRAGAGLGQVFEALVEEDLAAGRLVRVLEDWCPPFAGFYLYYPSHRQMRPALRAFVDFAARMRGAEKNEGMS